MLRTVSGRGSPLSGELKSQTLSHNSFVCFQRPSTVSHKHLGEGAWFLIYSVLSPSPMGVAILNKILGSHHLKNILSLFYSQVFLCFLMNKSFIYLDFPFSSSCIRDFLAFYAMCGKNPYWFLFLYSVIPCNFKTFHFIFKLVSFLLQQCPVFWFFRSTDPIHWSPCYCSQWLDALSHSALQLPQSTWQWAWKLIAFYWCTLQFTFETTFRPLKQQKTR